MNHTSPQSKIQNRKSKIATLFSLGECLVEFSRGEDGSFRPAFAGDAFNAIFYAGRLGLRTGFISALGDDLFAPMILEGIRNEGVDTSHLLHVTGRRNGIYFIELDDQGEYTFHFWRSGSAATQTLLLHDVNELAEYIAGSDFLLITGVGLAVLEGAGRLHTVLERIQGKTQIVFDTNYRPSLWDSSETFRRRMEEVLRFTDIFLPTLSDLRATYEATTPDDFFEQFSGFGITTTVIKMGSEGCAYMRDGKLVIIPPPPLERMVDATGAGDAFNAGFLAGMARGLKMDECCMLGHRVAARALGARGALDHNFDVSAVMPGL